MKAENANLTEKIKTDIAGIRDKYKKLLEQVQEIKSTLVVMIENEPRGRKRNRIVETTENQNKRGRFNGGRKSKTKEVIKKTIQKKPKNQKHNDVKIMSVIGGKNNKTTKLEPKNKEVIKKTIQKKPENQKSNEVKTSSTIGGKNNKTTKIESKTKEVIKKTIQKKQKNQKSNEVKIISTKVKNFQ